MKTPRTRQLPPLFTQPIGSLPRPQVVRDVLAARQANPAAADPALLDDLVLFAIRLQEQAGLDVVSDGEWRRSHYIGEFLARVGGFEKIRPYEHQGERKLTDVVVRRMRAAEPVFAHDAAFLAAHTAPGDEVRLAQPVSDRGPLLAPGFQPRGVSDAGALSRSSGRAIGGRSPGRGCRGHRHRPARRSGAGLFLRSAADGRRVDSRRAAAARVEHRAAVSPGAGRDRPGRRGPAGRGPPALLPQRLQAAERRSRRLPPDPAPAGRRAPSTG